MNTQVNEQMRYISLGSKHAFPKHYGKLIRAGEQEIAIFHTSDGQLYALENKSPHPKGGTLTEGIVSGHDLYCPLRDLRINLETGKVYAPDEGQVRVFPLNVKGEEVWLGLE
ncbi:nitrite reductase small subunit NirD [Marinicrinis sediminis]|uniref:Nitrite reductase small subunit NirD n=1 Tax=Marinicrinis sediminis TaxID=1652465 RepID=A0ABW5R793_9BACL